MIITQRTGARVRCLIPSDDNPSPGNFNQYELLTQREAPRVQVHLIDSDDEPRGAGEPPYPSVAPAITNAIYAASGDRIRRLPLRHRASG